MSVLSDAMLLECSRSSWSGVADRCRWCDGELEGRRKRWCSDACAFGAWREHAFAAGSQYLRWAKGARCVECGRTRDELDWRTGLEAHHVEPVLGKHAVTSCLHHLDKLELRCHECHVLEHVRLNAAARGDAPSAQLALDLGVLA